MAFMFKYASLYNQDLSSWDVYYVLNCEEFSNVAGTWTLPKPNFTNCDPN